MSKVLRIRAVWETDEEIDVPDDYEPGDPDSAIVDRLSSRHAVLVDWSVV